MPACNIMTSSCACGRVEVTATGKPLVCVICYCDDCQHRARQLEELPNCPPVAGPDQGTSVILFRKDRIACSKGASLLKSYKLKESSATNRVVATCCNAAMYMSLDDSRHWVSAYRSRFRGDISPEQMRICTKFAPVGVVLPADLPSYRGYPPNMMAKLVGAMIAKFIGR